MYGFTTKSSIPTLSILRLLIRFLLSALLGTRASRESSRPHSVGPSNADEILNMNNPRPRAARTSKLEELSGDHGNLGKSERTKQMEEILNFQKPSEGLELVILLHTQY